MAYTVLIVDDEREVIDVLKFSLQNLGYEVITAKNVEEALDYLAIQLPDLIISDIIMPGIDGLQFCKTIRKDPNTRHIPFVFISSKTSIEDRIKGLKTGADDYIAKPFNIVELNARLSMLFQRVEKSKQAALAARKSTKGSLGQINLVDLLGIFEMSKKTGLLTISKENYFGSLYLEHGNIIHCVFQDVEGEEAFYRLLRWKDEGEFEFTPAISPDHKTIEQGTHSLIMEGLKQIDEEKKGM
jgi:two-component system alkaline phosphatase synthesis response regulator PhoP